MTSGDADTTIQELKDLVIKFREDRNWAKHHVPKNLAISISIEAAELLELFQWDTYSLGNKDKIAAELSDILIYCFNMADILDIDITTEFKAKIAKASKKYPTSLFNSKTDSLDDYHRIKQDYRQKKSK